MGQSVWNGSRWRRVSDVEARLRRAMGQAVREDEKAPPPPPPQPVAKLAELPPKKPVITSSLAELTEAELEKLTAPGKDPGHGGDHLG